MKFARIIRNYGDYAYRQSGFNIGDAIQDYAIEHLYRKLGIPESQVVGIRSCEIQTYSGEYAILPVASIPLGTRGLGAMPFSSHIIPVFVSAHFLERDLSDEVVRYLSKFEPIGCRDEYSMSILNEHGVRCMLTGCLTMTLPKRKGPIENGKIFFADVPESALSFVPNDILEHAEMVTHLLPFDGDYPDNDVSAARYYERSISLLRRYEQEASLVVSSRLHALAPCLAMGIPTIAIVENISERFSWIDKFLTIYTPTTVKTIDWNAAATVTVSDAERDMLTNYFSDALKGVYDEWASQCEVSWYYENRKRAIYGSRFVEILKGAQPTHSGNFDYIIWGCGLIGETTYRVIEKHYPDARMIAAVDRYADGWFHGCQILRPESIGDALECNPNLVVLLTSYSGKQEGFEFMNRLGLREGQGFLYLGTQNG